MPDECQFLDEGKRRETDTSVITTHLESLLLLTQTREGRDTLREASVYPIIRELHMTLGERHDDVEEACDRLVQVLMGDEPRVEETKEQERISEVADNSDDDDGIQVVA